MSDNKMNDNKRVFKIYIETECDDMFVHDAIIEHLNELYNLEEKGSNGSSRNYFTNGKQYDLSNKKYNTLYSALSKRRFAIDEDKRLCGKYNGQWYYIFFRPV